MFCISNLGKIIQIVSHHESDSDQSTESGQAVQPEKERGHREPPQEQSSTESGQAVQPEKEMGHREPPQEQSSTESGRTVQPEKERGHREHTQEQSSTESGRAVQPEKDIGHREPPQEQSSTESGRAGQPEKDLDQEYLYVGDNSNNDSKSVNTLTLEMEVQHLIDRVTMLERGHAAVLNQQRHILQNQERILSRLTIQERQQGNSMYTTAQPCSYLNNNSFDDSFADYSFNDNQQPPAYIPPPPQHPPPPLYPPMEQQPPSSRQPLQHQPPPPDQQPSQHLPPPLHPPSAQQPLVLPHSSEEPAPAQSSQLLQPLSPISNENHAAGLQSSSSHLSQQNTPYRPPFQPLNSQDLGTEARATLCRRGKRLKPQERLPSSVIDRTKLVPAKVVIDRNPKLLCESKASTLALKLARESFFGEAVMLKCTVAGDRELPGLPEHEVQLLKNQILTLFPGYWNSPVEFEPLWTKCTESIVQGCKRLRRDAK